MDDNECSVIEVTGINPNTSEDTLENYFGSSRRGGDIANVKYIRGSGRALITFANAEGKTKAALFGYYCGTVIVKNLSCSRFSEFPRCIVFYQNTQCLIHKFTVFQYLA